MKKNIFRLLNFIIIFFGIFLILSFPFLYSYRATYKWILWWYAITVNIISIAKTIINKENLTQQLLATIIILVSVGFMLSNME